MLPERRAAAIPATAVSSGSNDRLHRVAPICCRSRVSASRSSELSPDVCQYLFWKSSAPPLSNRYDGGGLNQRLNLCSPFAERCAFLGLKFIDVVMFGFGVAQRGDVIERAIADLFW